MRHIMRKALALLLAILCLGSLCAAAAADDTRYPADQYFEADSSLTKGFTVQISAYGDKASAVKRRDSMLEKGYDSYIYLVDGKYRVMCGKFRTTEAAKHYRDHICSHTDRDSAYLTNVYLPEWAYTEFEKIYQTDPFNTQGQPYTAWEKPTGPYYDGDSAGSTQTVYTVQISAGTNFRRQEEHRDSLMAMGFDAFVYKRSGGYKTMSGMFNSSAEAELRCYAIKTYTAETDAFVTQVPIPTSYVNYNTWEDQAKYYGKYLEILPDYKWARTYLGTDQALTLVDGERKNDQLRYCYFVSDIDGNGVDELILLDCMKTGRGAWAIFSCDEKGEPYLVAWGYPTGQPTVSVCREKGVLAMQAHVNGVSSCEIYTLSQGKLLSAKVASMNGTENDRVEPGQVDAAAHGYYVELTPYDVEDLSRLTGSGGPAPADPTVPGSSVAPTTPIPSVPTATPAPTVTPAPVVTPPAGQSYTRDSVLAAARAAAQSDSHYSTVSEKNVGLEVPADSDFLKTPFSMKANAKENGKAIYIMPRPRPGNGTLGTVKHEEPVTILAETEYYYFFVTRDGRAGWNGKSFFSAP